MTKDKEDRFSYLLRKAMRCQDCKKETEDYKNYKDYSAAIEVEPHILADLIHWSRRYCAGRMTYAPSSFNSHLALLVRRNPELAKLDKKDVVLKDGWPWAIDGSPTVDARPDDWEEVESIYLNATGKE